MSIDKSHADDQTDTTSFEVSEFQVPGISAQDKKRLIEERTRTAMTMDTHGGVESVLMH